MCFTRVIVEGFAQMAKEDIFAFKILKEDSLEKGLLRSPSQTGTVWKANKLKKEPNFERIAKGLSINYGLHCCKTLEDARNYNHSTYYTNGSNEVYQVKIPKGSLYWENNTQICADQMILVSTQRYLKNGQLSKAKK